MQLNNCGTYGCNYNLPPSYSIDLSLVTSQQYVFRYTSINYQGTSNQGWPGFMIDQFGSNRFVFGGYNGNTATYTDVNYY